MAKEVKDSLKNVELSSHDGMKHLKNSKLGHLSLFTIQQWNVMIRQHIFYLPKGTTIKVLVYLSIIQLWFYNDLSTISSKFRDFFYPILIN